MSKAFLNFSPILIKIQYKISKDILQSTVGGTPFPLLALTEHEDDHVDRVIPGEIGELSLIVANIIVEVREIKSE